MIMFQKLVITDTQYKTVYTYYVADRYINIISIFYI